MSNKIGHISGGLLLVMTVGWSELGASGSIGLLAPPTTLVAASELDPFSGLTSEPGGGTVTQTLNGPELNGVTPEGQAIADHSQFLSGGSTILTVQVSNVNLPDGTELAVVLHFTPLGSIVLVGGQGTFTANLGHFGVSRDPVQIKHAGTAVLTGGAFR
jgi:hypothetical protein